MSISYDKREGDRPEAMEIENDEFKDTSAPRELYASESSMKKMLSPFTKVIH